MLATVLHVYNLCYIYELLATAFMVIMFALQVCLLWPPYVIAQTIIFLPCDFYLSFFPRLISAVGDRMSTILPHTVWS